MSPFIGTLNWITFVMMKSRPLAATSVEIKMFALDFWKRSNFYKRCFCIMWECKVTAFKPAASMKYFTLFEALIVFVNKIILEFSGNSLM